MGKALQAVRGMNDILPDDAEIWETVEEQLLEWLRSYGYRPLRLPVIEPTPLFKRAIGEATDIVEKEMYAFTDSLNGEELTLRPEGTAGCVRAAIQHNMATQIPQRLYYMGPMFRHERPQKGRYRQFHQLGVESLGYADPEMDAEHILMGARLWRAFEIDELVSLELNNLGELAERLRHREALIAYLETRQEELDDTAKQRLHTNPLRLFDSKNPAVQTVCREAPQLPDYLGETSRKYLETIEGILKSEGLSYRINPRLVRGLDYYNLAVYEWITDKLGAQGAICAGGRYDTLFEKLSGKPTPACGFALGCDRLLALLAQANKLPQASVPDVYLAHQGESARALAMTVSEQMRDEGLKVVLHCGQAGLKSQLKRADQSGAGFAVIIGEEEASDGSAQLKPLRGPDNTRLEGAPMNKQQRLPINALATAISNDYLDDKEEAASPSGNC